MRHIITICMLLLCITAGAQPFTSRLQKSLPNGGVVNVTQSAAIDELVNGKPAPTTTTEANPSAERHNAKTELAAKPTEKPAEKAAEKTAEKPTEKTAEKPAEKAVPTKETIGDDMEIPVVDMRKKVMRRSQKVNGYRVQAFAGGNTRNDRKKAEQVGNNIKMKYPDEPIYVHFYSPRWICRVGNYRTYEEANRMLQNVRKMGYKSASIVKGKITVFN